MKATIDTWWPEKVRSKRGLGQRRLEQIEAVMPPVPITKRADLWNGLNRAFYAYWYKRNRRRAPPASEIKKRLATIAATGRRLLRHLDLGEHPRPHGETVHDLPYLLLTTFDPAVKRDAERRGGFSDFPPQPNDPPTSSSGETDYRTFEKLNNVVEGLQMLVAWSDDAITALKEGRGDPIQRRPSGPPTRNDEALDGLVLRLGQLYQDATGRKAGMSRSHTGELGGPFFRFVLAFCATSRIRMTLDGLEKRWRKIRPRLHAPDQVRKKSEPANLAQ